MRAIKILFAAIVLFGLSVVPPSASAEEISLSDCQIEWIGDRIFFNECGRKESNLICWNKGEDFISLGIGHFIWYPEGKIGPYDEMFPELIKFIESKGRAVPDWLRGPGQPRCPWQSREEFLQDRRGPKVCELQAFLLETRDLQLLFIIDRMKKALPKLLAAVPERSRPHIAQQFNRLASTPAGTFALIDYVNFKGEGIAVTERYKSQGWGLLQVLEWMEGTTADDEAVREFVVVAQELLTKRVCNAPSGKSEARWLRGWKKRVSTYLDAIDACPS